MMITVEKPIKSDNYIIQQIESRTQMRVRLRKKEVLIDLEKKFSNDLSWWILFRISA